MYNREIGTSQAAKETFPLKTVFNCRPEGGAGICWACTGAGGVRKEAYMRGLGCDAEFGTWYKLSEWLKYRKVGGGQGVVVVLKWDWRGLGE